MAKKITELPTLSSADNDDLIPIVDISGAVTKKVTAAGMGAAAVNGAPDKSITLPKLNGGSTAGLLATDSSGNVTAQPIPFGSIGYSTYGMAGGQVIGASSTVLGFNAVIGSLVDVTNPASGQLQVTRDGSYNIAVGTSIVDSVQTANAISLQISTDGGTTWIDLVQMTPNTIIGSTGRGLSISTVKWLAANTRVRSLYYSGGGSTRVAAPDVTRTSVCSLSIKG